MKVTYLTGNEARRARAAAAGSTVNGIASVEVDTDRPGTLTLRLFHDAALSPANLAIAGGVAGLALVIRSIEPAAAGVAKTLTVAPPEGGDPSKFRLSLIQGKERPIPPDGFDPLLSTIEISFHPDAPRDSDCEAAPRAAAALPAPPIDYLAKDWNSFRQLMLDRLATAAPGWTERNPADLGVALVEILALAADHLSYYQDAIATEAYLGTARRRISVRRHARLADYLVHEGANARTWVVLDVSRDVFLPRTGTHFLTRCAGGVTFQPDELEGLLQQRRPVPFEPMHHASLREAHNEILFHAWDGGPLCLPAGATRATLADKLDTDGRRRLSLAAGDVLVFEEVRSPATGEELDADPSRRHAVRLTRVLPLVDPGTTPPAPLLDVAWDADDALPFPLCISGGKKDPPSVARGNVVLADHGLTIDEEELDPPVVPAEGRYRPRLRRRGLTHAAPLGTPPPPAAASLVQDPSAAVPAIAKIERTGGVRWEVRRDLLRSRPDAREVVVETDDAGTAHLRFGDGVLGASPAPDPPGAPETRLLATYRIGRGETGNVGADVIAHVVTSALGVRGVRNPLPARGGVDPEPLDHVRRAAPRAFRTQERAVTDADYVAAARRFPGVRGAAAFRRVTGSFTTHFVAVTLQGGAPVDEPFKARLRDFLERFRLSGAEIVIVPPAPVPIDISLLVRVAPGHLRSILRASLAATFSAGVLEGGRRAFFHPDSFTFGQPVYLGQVVSAILATPGVLSVDTTDGRNHFRRSGGAADDLGRGRIAIAPTEIAVPGNTELHFEGGL